MPPLVIPATIQMRPLWTLNGIPWALNVMHGIIGPGAVVNQALANEVATAFATAMDATPLGGLSFQAGLVNNVILESVGVRDIRVANQPEFVAVVGAMGGTASDPIPAGVAQVVTLRTALAGASFRGRVYLSGQSEAVNDANGQISSDGRTRALNFIVGLIDSLLTTVTSEIALAIASRVLGDSTPVTTAVSRDSLWDTQRRRADGTL